uniref:Uncharacterized protein n=1 Tax=Arundo donax TaxID=35708 RepID=A0A0A9AR68_ARUDO
MFNCEWLFWRYEHQNMDPFFKELRIEDKVAN